MEGNTFSLDEIDLHILTLLQKDGKMNTKEIALQVGLSNTPTYERIKRIERLGIIRKYVAVIDKRKMGYNLIVFCNIQLKTHAYEFLEEFEKAVVELEEMVDCYHIAGHFDYLLKIEMQDMEAYSVFVKEKLAKIPHISTVQSSFVMRTLKSI